MKTMYKEEFSKKRLPVVLEIVFLMVLVIATSDYIKRGVSHSRMMSLLITFIALFVVVLFAAIAILKCRYKLRYSVIADKFFVHKISGQESRVEENIKIKDITNIKRVSIMDYAVNRIKNDSYLVSIPSRAMYVCSYKHENKCKAFFFQPSDSLLRKLAEAMNNENDRMVS